EAALSRSFSGEVPGASTVEEIASACLDAATRIPAPTRVVVGDMARELIRLRTTEDDAAWDALLDTMYPRPEPD
ncbi:hypothetical protein K2X89_18085, partial [Myxococcota bacterium]|nr:hypothetical protein [Myxococcota bacterium]